MPLIVKDMKIILSDRKALLILIGMPIILFTILSFALQGSFSSASSQVWDIDVAMVKNYDFEEDFKASGTYMSRQEAMAIEEVMTKVFESQGLEFVRVQWMDLETAMAKLEEDSIASAVVLQENYMADLLKTMMPGQGGLVTVKVYTNPEKAYSASIVSKVINQVTQAMSRQIIENKIVVETMTQYGLDPTELIQAPRQTPVDVVYEDYTIDQLKKVTSAQYYSVAMMAMFILFGASYGSKFMLIEKKKFTLQRQQVAGISPFKLLVGKMVIIFCVGLLQISAMILTSHLGFKVYWGKPSMVVLVTLLTAFAVMGFGTILAGLALKADNFKVLNLLESGVFQVVALFGGSYFPIFLMPLWFQTISKLLINGAALDVYLKVMMDAPFKDLLPGILSLGLNGLVFLSIGLWIVFHDPTIKVRRAS